MALFNFNLITNPPADEFVNEATQLNANWNDLETKLSWFQAFGTITTGILDPGFEALISGRQAVWNGTAMRNPSSIPGTWSPWATLSPVSPYVLRTGFPIKWRSNNTLRKVELTGGFLNTVSASAFPHTAYATLINAGISSAFKPVGGTHFQHSATAAITSATVGVDVATARIRVTQTSTNPCVIDCHYLGADGGGNFVMLDGVEWYY